MTFDSYVFTNIGGKKVNEDSVRFAEFPGGFSAVVADGVGSNGGGDIASSICAQMFIEGLRDCQSDNDINTLTTAANNAIIAEQTMSVKMKSTIVAVNVLNEKTTFIHAGDSRGYIFRDGRVFFQTFDHSIPQMDVLRGVITPAQIRFHKNRNKILRALGIENTAPEISGREKLMPGDALLLCTDGFWEYVTEAEMCEDITKSHTAEEWVKFMLGRLGSRISENTDNLSAIGVLCI
jgi:serine/threonine protein phosphatase PrpC